MSTAADRDLHYRTPAAWAQRVLAEPNALLSDHAHCELGAAAAAQSLIARKPEATELVRHLSGLAIEELRHFRLVEKLLRKRGGRLGAVRPNSYVKRLNTEAATTGQGDVLLDRLLVAGLIEARSHERFELLAQDAEDGELRDLFASLLVSEAAHAKIFDELARSLYPPAVVDRRWSVLAPIEGQIIESEPFSVRVHSGLATH